MNRAEILKAEATAAVGRVIAARYADISVAEVRDRLPRQLDAAIGDFAIQAALRASGFKSLGGGMYRRERPKVKPPRPRRAK